MHVGGGMLVGGLTNIRQGGGLHEQVAAFTDVLLLAIERTDSLQSRVSEPDFQLDRIA